MTCIQCFTDASNGTESPVEIMVCIGLVAAGTISVYVILLYMPTFASTQLGLPLGEAFTAQSIGLVCLILIEPLCGALSDRVGRKP
jgi:MFS transporter, MHS family, proline/betaine transporter